MTATLLPAAGLERAVACLRAGGIVAYPTETYYGLAVDPFLPAALERLFDLKARSPSKAVLTLVGDTMHIAALVAAVPETAIRVMAHFWPGAVTIVLPAAATLPSLLTGGSGGIGVRISPHPLARALVKAYGGPITSTSANLTGEPPAITAVQVMERLGHAVDVVLDGGDTPGGPGSTLVSASDTGLVLLRQGCVPFADILLVSGDNSECTPRRL